MSHAIGFTRAAEQRILVEVTLQYTSLAEYVGDAAVATAIETWSDANLDIGEDVYLSKISGVVIDLGGVANVSLVELSIFPAAVAPADVTITARQIGTINGAPGGDVTITSTLLVP